MFGKNKQRMQDHKLTKDVLAHLVAPRPSRKGEQLLGLKSGSLEARTMYLPGTSAIARDVSDRELVRKNQDDAIPLCGTIGNSPRSQSQLKAYREKVKER